MPEITINYSGDFRELKTIRKIYDLFIENNFHPRNVVVNHDVSKGEGSKRTSSGKEAIPTIIDNTMTVVVTPIATPFLIRKFPHILVYKKQLR